MAELHEEQNLSDSDVQRAILVTQLQIRDYLATLLSAQNEIAAGNLENLHQQGDIALDFPFYDPPRGKEAL